MLVGSRGMVLNSNIMCSSQGACPKNSASASLYTTNLFNKPPSGMSVKNSQRYHDVQINIV